MSIYDDHSPISADILEWLLGDEKVASQWKEMAIRLRLEPCIPPIDQNISIKRKKFDKQKLREFMSVWRRALPQSYTVSNLIRVLGQVGCSDMVNWLILLHSGDSRKKIEIASLIDASRSTTPNSYSPYSWHSAGGGSNDERPESSRSFTSDDRESSPARPISSCSSSETLRRTMTTTTTTRTVEKRIFNGYSPKNKAQQVRSPQEPPYSSHRGRTHHPSQHHLVTPPSSFSSKSPKVVSFKDTAEEYDNDSSSGGGEILEPLPKGISMEKYFDNLISMIQDAAEDLKV